MGLAGGEDLNIPGLRDYFPEDVAVFQGHVFRMAVMIYRDIHSYVQRLPVAIEMNKQDQAVVVKFGEICLQSEFGIPGSLDVARQVTGIYLPGGDEVTGGKHLVVSEIVMQPGLPKKVVLVATGQGAVFLPSPYFRDMVVVPFDIEGVEGPADAVDILARDVVFRAEPFEFAEFCFCQGDVGRVVHQGVVHKEVSMLRLIAQESRTFFYRCVPRQTMIGQRTQGLYMEIVRGCIVIIYIITTTGGVIPVIDEVVQLGDDVLWYRVVGRKHDGVRGGGVNPFNNIPQKVQFPLAIRVGKKDDYVIDHFLLRQHVCYTTSQSIASISVWDASQGTLLPEGYA